MPQPMPPPQGPPAQGGPQGAPQGGAAPLQNLMENIAKGLDHINMVFSQNGAATPQEKQLAQQVSMGFGKLMDSVLGGGDSAEPDGDEGQGQTVPQEAGGNKGAIPHPGM